MSLRISNACKSFGGLEILDDVSIEIPSDRIIGLIGPNGAGKSTLFAAIGGSLPLDSGSIMFDDAALDGRSPQARAAAGLVRTFQVPRPFSHLTVRENLAVAAPGQRGERLLGALLGGPGANGEQREIAERADETLDFLNLDGVADQLAGTLSGGQRKLLEIGRALMTSPRMLLLDEPFAGVNPVLFGEISGRIEAINARGVGFFIIEHNIPALARIATTLHVLDRGQIIARGEPKTVIADPCVRDAYMGGTP